MKKSRHLTKRCHAAALAGVVAALAGIPAETAWAVGPGESTASSAASSQGPGGSGGPPGIRAPREIQAREPEATVRGGAPVREEITPARAAVRGRMALRPQEEAPPLPTQTRGSVRGIIT